MIDREVLKQIIADQREYRPPKTFFDRTQSHIIRNFFSDPSILIISGIRRSGKSTLQRILKQEQEESDYYFNFDDDRLVHFSIEDFQVLLEIFIVRINNQIIQVIQVALSLSDEKVRNKEIDGLIEAMSAYGLSEGHIITENEQSTLNIEQFQIKIIPIWKWLLGAH